MKTNTKCHWEHFSHEADIGIRGYGDTMESAFAQAAIAMIAAICDVTTVKALTSRQIQCEAPDHELLFVDWLNALIISTSSAWVLPETIATKQENPCKAQ